MSPIVWKGRLATLLLASLGACQNADAGGVSPELTGGTATTGGGGAGGSGGMSEGPGGRAGAQAVAGASPAGAAGNLNIAGTSTASGSSGGGASGGVSGASGAAAGGGTEAAAGAGATNPCAYPSGPYGLEPGKVVDPSYSWQGYDATGTWRTITPMDMLDCDGRQGRNAVVIRDVAAWCGVCSRVNRETNALMDAEWRAKGVAVFVFLAQDGASQKATDQNTRDYWEAFEPKGWAVLTDPSPDYPTWTWEPTLMADPAVPIMTLPFQVVVDPRTMKIVAGTADYSMDPRGLKDVLERNAPP